MGNHHSSSSRQGKLDSLEFPTTACVLRTPDSLGKRGSAVVLENKHTSCKVGLLRKRNRSQSLICPPPQERASDHHEPERRGSWESFATHSLASKIKKSKIRQNQQHSNTPPPSVIASGAQSKQPLTEAETTETGSAQVERTEETMNPNVEKFAKLLAQVSRAMDSPSKKHDDHSISREAFQNYVVPLSPVGEKYLWGHYTGWQLSTSTIKTSAFIQHTEKLFAAITDKDQTSFYVKMFGKDKDTIDRDGFVDLLLTSYQLSPAGTNKSKRDLSSTAEFDGKEWLESVTKSCFHIKEVMSVFYVSNWLTTNLPTVFAPVHKYFVHQLVTGYTTLSSKKTHPTKSQVDKVTPSDKTDGEEDPTAEHDEVPGMQPVLMWLLHVSLPKVYLNALDKKEEAKEAQVKQLLRMNSRDMVASLLSCGAKTQAWTPLYNSSDHGLSINRFQYHVFNYRGPSLLFLRCDNDYEILVGVDTEWKENCHFWGGEQCLIIMLKPEFRVVEKGDKCLYANFSIRGYPFGIQVGKDPRNVSLEIKPDFEHVNFKKIPTRIVNLTVWGCGSTDTKAAQSDHKKWEAKECEKQKKINLNAGEWSDNPDKYLLELAGNYKSYGS